MNKVKHSEHMFTAAMKGRAHSSAQIDDIVSGFHPKDTLSVRVKDLSTSRVDAEGR